MSDTSPLSGSFAVAPPELMDASTYQHTLERLVTEGHGVGKTQPVAAFLLRNLRLVTETESGVDEVEKEINVEPLYLVMDLAQYPNDYVQKLVVRDIMAKYASRIIGDAELNSPDFKGPGLWTTKKSSFEGDYVPDSAERNVFQPNEDAYRLCLTIDKPIIIPTAWGKPFTVEAGGTIAIRERDVVALTEVLQRIQDGEITSEEGLLQTEAASKFDVYGMNPGFLEANYEPVSLKPETYAAIEETRSQLEEEPNP